ncbi:BGTF surface domain-containing protein [Halorubellus salinus]|uniref:BGTF surface domain-containing protein n=1 Tax=Halorubellus salinus TaxID=755309 RepID=UPI001D06AAFF|nr:BGTF surface domain-containing protein [Halorubellus salinus]
MSRRPARETVAFAVALAAIAALGGVAAANVAASSPASASGPGSVGAVADAPPNATIDSDGERLVVEQAADERISGTSNLESGTQVTVRARSSNGGSPFLRSAVATVNDDGSFATTFDFGDVQVGTEFTVSVYKNGTELASAPGVVGECAPNCGEPTGDAAFTKNIYQTAAGDTVEIGVDMTGRDNATVRFGSDATNVVIPVTVEDGNGDGTVVLQFETAVDAPNAHGMSAKADADTVTVPQDVDRPDSLAAGEYELSLSLDTRTEPVEVDVATVILQEGSDAPPTTRGGDAGTTTVGTIYGTAATSTPDGDGGVSMTTVGALAVGGVLAILGVVALVGDFD